MLMGGASMSVLMGRVLMGGASMSELMGRVR